MRSQTEFGNEGPDLPQTPQWFQRFFNDSVVRCKIIQVPACYNRYIATGSRCHIAQSYSADWVIREG